MFMNTPTPHRPAPLIIFYITCFISSLNNAFYILWFKNLYILYQCLDHFKTYRWYQEKWTFQKCRHVLLKLDWREKGTALLSDKRSVQQIHLFWMNGLVTYYGKHPRFYRFSYVHDTSHLIFFLPYYRNLKCVPFSVSQQPP